MKSFAQRFLRIVHPQEDGEARIDPRKIYILPTGYGVLYGAACLMMVLGSLNYGSNLGLLFSFLFTGIGLVGILHTWRNLLGLQIRIGNAAPVFAGEDAAFPLFVSDHSGRRRDAVWASAKGNPPQQGDVPADGECRLEIVWTTRERGEFPLGRVQISTRAPLGLLRAWALVEPAATVLVYPAPAAHRGPEVEQGFSTAEHGDRGVGTDDFVGLRQYRVGDAPRHIDWKALARGRGLLTRQFGGDRREQIWLEWDRLAGMDTEERLRQLCRGVLDAVGEGLTFGLRLPQATLDPDAGDLHKHRCLEALARFGTAREHARVA